MGKRPGPRAVCAPVRGSASVFKSGDYAGMIAFVTP